MRRLAVATHRLYADASPFEPYRYVNALQRAFPDTVPLFTRLLIAPALRAPAPARVRGLIYANGAALLTQEAIMAWADADHRARLPVPPSLWRAWSGPINRPHSRFVFGFFLFYRIRVGLNRMRTLLRHSVSGNVVPSKPYVVAIDTPAGTAAGAERGGILSWLHDSAPLAEKPAKICVVSRFVTPADRQTHPDWVEVWNEPFPPLQGNTARIEFAVEAAALTVGVIFSAIFGKWQSVVLYADLIDAAYFRRIRSAQRPLAVIFSLGSMPDRPLWTHNAEASGCATPLLYYASSYSLFCYSGTPVSPEIRSPVILENHWTCGWFQTRGAADHLARILKEHRSALVVGAFDMSDSGEPLPPLPRRAVAVFDVEPAACASRLSCAGYIVPNVLEDIAVEFWRALASLARTLDLVLVHKPKRTAELQGAWRYRGELSALASEGRYIGLPPEIGAGRLLKAVPASIVLPFTSVGDLAQALNRPAIYFDAAGTIPDAELHAVGTPVARGEDELATWLGGYYSEKTLPARAGGCPA